MVRTYHHFYIKKLRRLNPVDINRIEPAEVIGQGNYPVKITAALDTYYVYAYEYLFCSMLVPIKTETSAILY